MSNFSEIKCCVCNKNIGNVRFMLINKKSKFAWITYCVKCFKKEKV